MAFTYSATGKRLTMSDVSGVTTYTYDPQTDRLMQKQTPEGMLNYTYDAAGNLKSLQSQNQGGASDAYTYDADNRLSTATNTSGQTTYAYDNVGNLQSFAYPNGVATAYTYDSLNRLTQMGAGKNGTLQANYVYTLGAAGNRLSVAELSGRTVNYGYDSLYRLTSETVSADPHGKNGTGSYTYDSVGNRLTLNSSLPPAGIMNYSYDADDRLGSDQYDPNGNTTSSSGTANVYDFENHLIQHGAQPGAVTIVYDGDGNRVSETVAGVTTKYLIDTQNPTGYAQVVDEIQNGAVTKTYSYGLERISQNWQPTTGNWQPAFYGYDGHGSVRQLTNSAGAVTDTYDFDAFGNLISSTGSTPNNYLFAGERYDPALGLYYNRARYLNTATGRFWSMDEHEGDPQSPLSLHKYLYVGNDPVLRQDPSGHDFDIATTVSVAADYAVIGAIAGISASAGIALTAGIFLADNLPHNAFTKPPDATVVGFQAGWSPSGALAESDNPFLFGLAIGLQFTSIIGGLELVHKNDSEDIWAYGYLGAVAGRNLGVGGGNPLFSGKGSPYSPFGVLGNSAAYAGSVWNLDYSGAYEGVFSCVSVTPKIRALFPKAPAQVGGTVCTGEKAPGKDATYTYTVGVSPANSTSGTALQLGITTYSFIEPIPIKQLENPF